MALRLILETLDGLSEDVAAEYVKQDDGSFLLQTIAVGALKVEDVSGLKNTIATLRTTERTLKAQIKNFEGIEDPQAARDALAKMGEIADWDGDKKVTEAVEIKVKQIAAKHLQELEGVQKLLGNAETQLEANLIKASATDALQGAGGKIKLMLPHVLNQDKMRKTDDGRYIAEVIDADGNPRVGDGSGNPMTIPQLIAEMKTQDDFADGFQGSGSSGSGSKGGDKNQHDKGQKTVTAAGSHVDNLDIAKVATGEIEVVPAT